MQRWNGTTWTSIGTGIAWSMVMSVAFGPGDEVFAGGYFEAAGVEPAERMTAMNIARWDGGAWSALAADLDGDGVVDFTDYLEF